MSKQNRNPQWLQEAMASAMGRLARACVEGNIEEILWAQEELAELREYEAYAWDDEMEG